MVLFRVELTDSCIPSSLNLEGQVVQLQSLLDIERQKKEACQREVTRLVAQLQVTKDKLKPLDYKSNQLKHSVSLGLLSTEERANNIGYSDVAETIDLPPSMHTLSTSASSCHMNESLHDSPEHSTHPLGHMASPSITTCAGNIKVNVCSMFVAM